MKSVIEGTSIGSLDLTAATTLIYGSLSAGPIVWITFHAPCTQSTPGSQHAYGGFLLAVNEVSSAPIAVWDYGVSVDSNHRGNGSHEGSEAVYISVWLY